MSKLCEEISTVEREPSTYSKYIVGLFSTSSKSFSDCSAGIQEESFLRNIILLRQSSACILYGQYNNISEITTMIRMRMT
jgi:hypothetical protein